VDAEIRPEPTPEQRRALLAALDAAADERPAAHTNPWRRAVLAAEDDYDATAPPRSRRGATRA
jgi:hypothetical protein